MAWFPALFSCSLDFFNPPTPTPAPPLNGLLRGLKGPASLESLLPHPVLLSVPTLKCFRLWQHVGPDAEAPSSISHVLTSQPEASPGEAHLILLLTSCCPWGVTWVP